jgi:hypothetical protein
MVVAILVLSPVFICRDSSLVVAAGLGVRASKVGEVGFAFVPIATRSIDALVAAVMITTGILALSLGGGYEVSVAANALIFGVVALVRPAADIFEFRRRFAAVLRKARETGLMLVVDVGFCARNYWDLIIRARAGTPQKFLTPRPPTLLWGGLDGTAKSLPLCIAILESAVLLGASRYRAGTT